MKEWDHKDEWRLWGNGFMVSVVRHTGKLDRGEMHAFMTCVDKWAMEHGIYPSHPEDSEYQKMKIEFGEAV